MNAAVVLINWRSEAQTLRCVRALKAWKILKPSIVVVDNESTEVSRSALRHELVDKDQLVYSSMNLGFAGGNNLGIKRALSKGNDRILLVNTDAEVSEACALRLLQTMDERPDVSILGPAIIEGDALVVGGRDIARHPFTRIVAPPATLENVENRPPQRVDYVSGTVFLARASVFEKVGLLDEKFFFSGEIADFCRRAHGEKHGAFVDLEARAYHDTKKTPQELRNTLYVYYSLRNRFLYINKHHAAERFRYHCFWTGIGIVQAVRALAHGQKGKARATLLGLRDGLLNRFGNQNGRFGKN